MNRRKIILIAAPILILVVLWWSRGVAKRFFPIKHQGVVMRIKPFSKTGHFGPDKDTRQRYQFAIIFEDGFDCEGYDTSFAAIEPGDEIRIRGYPDWAGFPIINPEWGECDEAQLVELVQAKAPGR